MSLKLTVRERLRSSVNAILGDPVLPREIELTEGDYEAALIRYYTWLPISVTRMYTFTAVQRERYERMASLFPDSPLVERGEKEASDYFYVGVTRFANTYQQGLYSVPQNLNGFLLGTQSVPINMIIDPLAPINNTLYDMTVGDTYYEEQWHSGTIHWVVGTMTMLAVTYGIGCTDLEILPLRHHQLMSYVLGEIYYERLLAIRKTGRFNSNDFSLDTSFLEAKLAEVKEKSQTMLYDNGLMTATIG